MRRPTPAVCLALAAFALTAVAGLAAANPAHDPVERGRQLYGASCAGCHGQSGEGFMTSPSLRGVGAASADFQLSTGRMPLSAPDARPHPREPAFDHQDIAALTAFVASLGGGPQVPAVGPGDPRKGRTLYLASCASCHSASGVGAALPGGGAAPSLLNTKPTQVAEAVRLGPGAMPAFDTKTLTEAEVNSIIAYIGTVRDEFRHGGAAIGGAGPVPEGLVAWVIGLGVLILVILFLGRRAS
ncbi:cytochrome bc1 complex diheme cytochrome c subunit [Sinosporangium siamense]|nr:cytochrome c [Sinosporangium siamense]